VFDGFHSKLILVDVDDVLISWIRLKEGIELVHLPDVGPQVHQTGRDLEVTEESSCNSNVLKLWHQLAIKATHCVSRKEACPLACQHLVDPVIEISVTK